MVIKKMIKLVLIYYFFDKIMLTDKELSKAVDLALREDGRSLENICNDYNSMYLKEIQKGKRKPLNKDFISRLRNNRFKVRSKRVLFFCEFLGVEPNKKESQPTILEQQVRELTLFIRKQKNAPEFEELWNFLGKIFANTNLQKTP